MSLYLHFLVSPSEDSERLTNAFLGAKYATASAVSICTFKSSILY